MSLRCRLRFLTFGAEDQTIVDEELAAQHAEQQQAGDDVGDRGRDAELRLQRFGALGQNGQHQRDRDHCKGIELAEPRHRDGGEAHAVGHAVVKRTIGAGDDDEADNTADCAGQEHGAHHDAADVHAGIARRVDGVADNGDFITVLGVAHVDEDEYHQRQHDDPPAMDAENLRQTGGAVKLRNDLRAGASFPRTALQPCDDANDDIVHHQGEERLIGVPLRLEERGDQAPDAAGEGGSQRHDDQQQRGRQQYPILWRSSFPVYLL